MIAAAAAQLLVGFVAVIVALNAAGDAGVYEAVTTAAGTAFFSVLWLVSAGLFRRAAGS